MIDIHSKEIHAETTSVSRFMNYLAKSRREIRIWDLDGWGTVSGQGSSPLSSSSGLGGSDGFEFEILRMVDLVPKRVLFKNPEDEIRLMRLVADSLQIQEELVRTSDISFDPTESGDPTVLLLKGNCHTADIGSCQPPEVVRFAFCIGRPNAFVTSQLQDFAEAEDLGLVLYDPESDRISQILNIRRKSTCQKQPFNRLHQMDLGSKSKCHR